MNPVICYIYEYKKNQKMRNIGFVKIQGRYKAYVFSMNMKGLPIRKDDCWQLFVFFKDGEYCVVKRVADVCGEHNMLHTSLEVKECDLPEARSLMELDGILICGPREEKCVALWKNVPVNVEMLRTWEEVKAEEVTPKEDLPDVSEPTPDTAGPVMEEEEGESVPDEEDGLWEPDVEAEEVQQSTGRRYRKIQREDMTELPRRDWRLANNSFLLHGYYSYKHLVLIEEEEQLWLGVPGIYDAREARAAELFGFPQFTKEGAGQLDLSEEERNDEEEFGYWCRHIPLNSRR